MSNSNLKKPGRGSRARKVDPPRRQKPDQAPSPKPAPQPEERPLEAAIAAPAVVQVPAVQVPAVQVPAVQVTAVASVNAPTIDFQVIAMAYGNYTRKSLEQTKSFFDKLAGVRSLDKAIEIQTEFVKQACETFVTEFAGDSRTLQRPRQTELPAFRGHRRPDDSGRALNPAALSEATGLPCEGRQTSCGSCK